ncbi:hypothetical protein HNQ93_002002 [Hymenobacter luteus]|uniref:Uncharacterized protein n=2 Tax=Hymenobacter TaxID=89966 RepID=A0A7W9T0I3_9BACT|nr:MULTISPECIES: hypothetical protein [Hymenobacter]MBB4600637.1 hypothetical protein [Hymenobacter latericoloratus]MBB6059156.1 hypothetical protein [Hymenobacter luteus]
MLSTQNYAALPDMAGLRRLCQSLAVLDAINSQDLEYRYYTFDPNWDQGEALFEMNDGEGDQMLVLFREEGCCINGYLEGYDQPDKAQLTRGLPEVFDEFMFGEPVSSIGTTFCLWFTPAHGWQTGLLSGEDDGSDELLYILDGNPATYAEWANEYYIDETDRDPIDAEAVARIYQHEPLTRELVKELIDPLEDWPQLQTDLQAIGYPYQLA